MPLPPMRPAGRSKQSFLHIFFIVLMGAVLALALSGAGICESKFKRRIKIQLSKSCSMAQAILLGAESDEQACFKKNACFSYRCTPFTPEMDEFREKTRNKAFPVHDLDALNQIRDEILDSPLLSSIGEENFKESFYQVIVVTYTGAERIGEEKIIEEDGGLFLDVEVLEPVNPGIIPECLWEMLYVVQLDGSCW